MRRLREISRFECDVRVLRNGFCKIEDSLKCHKPLSDLAGRSVLSGELVPGDVYEVSDPSLTQLPCDSLLLAGDCIINESMLTGKYALVIVRGFLTFCFRRIHPGFKGPRHRRCSYLGGFRCNLDTSKRCQALSLLWHQDHSRKTTSRCWR